MAVVHLLNPCAFSQDSTAQRTTSTCEANFSNYLPDHILSVCETPGWRNVAGVSHKKQRVLNVLNVNACVIVFRCAAPGRSHSVNAGTIMIVICCTEVHLRGPAHFPQTGFLSHPSCPFPAPPPPLYLILPLLLRRHLCQR